MTSLPRSHPHVRPLPGDLADAVDGVRPTLGSFATRILYYPSIGSTNDEAARLADAGAPEGTTVVAGQQSAGRGRLGRVWHSPPGSGLYVSLVFRPDGGGPGPSLPSVLTLVSGVALAEAVRETTGLPVTIKWPNDLVHEGRKIAGILAEGSAQGAVLDYVILGFGLNVRAVLLPPDLAARASSLEDELGRPVDRGALFAGCLVKLCDARAALRAGAIAPLLARWRALSPSAVGTRVSWRSPGGLRRGLTAGLDDQGALLIEIGGRLERVVAGEVGWE